MCPKPSHQELWLPQNQENAHLNMEKVLQTIRASSNRQVTFYEGSSLSSSDFFYWDDIKCPAQHRSVDDVGNGDDNENGEDGDSVDAVGKD